VSALERQVGGDHYKGGTPQPAEVAWSWDLPFAEGSVLKYLFRWSVKRNLQDLQKAHHWIEMILEHYSTNQPAKVEEAPLPGKRHAT
jgi:hypothetical protein